jgi:hypothetical protein
MREKWGSGIMRAGEAGWTLKTTLIGGSHLLAGKGKRKKKREEGAREKAGWAGF